jgi:FKBP-type peptidyl-prolyl cis-trans isomerase FkpA
VQPTPVPDGQDDFCRKVNLLSLPGGLQQADFQVGSGPVAQVGHCVNMNYTGWTTDGHEFDSSRKPGGTPFKVESLGGGSVIKGWDQGIPGMRVGGRRRLVIPPDLGYGASGSGAAIPPNATLIFDVELVSLC